MVKRAGLPRINVEARLLYDFYMLLKASVAPAFSDQIFQIRVFISMRFRYILIRQFAEVAVHAQFDRQAFSRPIFAIIRPYLSVAFVSAIVLVRGTAPGIFPTQ